MNDIEQGKRENKFYAVIFVIMGVIFLGISPLADTSIGMALGGMVGLVILSCGVWLFRTNKVAWSVTDGFTPKSK